MAAFYVDPGNTNVAAWQASYDYSIGDRVYPTDNTTTASGYIYECTTDAGSSGGTEPTWVYTTPDTSTTTDGGITWTCRNADSWTEALPSLINALHAVVAGDTVYCRGSETLATAVGIDFAGHEGTSTNNLYIVGCNASGDVDGTQYEIDGNSVASYGLNLRTGGGGDYINFINLKIHSCGTGVSISSATSGYCYYINVDSSNNTGSGFLCYYGTGNNFIFCKSNNNGGYGVGYNWAYGNNHIFCESINNSLSGFGGTNNSGGAPYFLGCISCANTEYGIRYLMQGLVLYCTIDGNGIDGIESSFARARIFANRITNNTGYAIDSSGTSNVLLPYGWNYINGNGNEVDSHLTKIFKDADTNVLTGTDGYLDPGSPNYDYNIDNTASLRNLLVSLTDRYTDYYMTAGLPPEDLAGGGGFIQVARPNSLLRR